jgi:Zn-dependent peptidase ImmA (M78 family)/DNA-binding XRE family transcriptional regulator
VNNRLKTMNNFSQTLINTRERLNFNQKSVGEKMGLSPSLISKWEKGDRVPDVNQLMELSRLYGVTIDFLMGQEKPVVFQSRARVTLSAEKKTVMGHALNDAAQQIYLLQRAWEKTERKPSRCLLLQEWDESALEDQAQVIRDQLNLNRSVTLAELKQALAEKNVHVFEWYLPSQLFGLSHHDNFTVIFINRALPEPQRLFTLAHELAHVIYHLREDKSLVSDLASRNDPKEKEANRWASEFLMPHRQLEKRVKDLGSHLRYPQIFHRLAQEWNVSPEALFYRLASMQIVRWSEKNRYLSAPTTPSAEPWPRVTNIFSQIAPAMIDAGLKAWIEETITSGKLAEWWATTREAVDDFLSQLETPEPLTALGLIEEA